MRRRRRSSVIQETRASTLAGWPLREAAAAGDASRQASRSRVGAGLAGVARRSSRVYGSRVAGSVAVSLSQCSRDAGSCKTLLRYGR